MICEAGVTIGGFKFKKVDGIRVIQSVFIQDAKKGSCEEIPVSDNNDIDKEKLAKELHKYFRKDVVIIIDIENIPDRLNSNYVDVRFVGVKDIQDA